MNKSERTQSFHGALYLILGAGLLMTVPHVAMAQYGRHFDKMIEEANRQQRPVDPPSGAPAQRSPAQPDKAERAPAAPGAARAPRDAIPVGQYEITSQSRSKLAPGQSFEHDPTALPRRDARWTASYESFTAPEATRRYAEGSRSVVMRIITSHESFKGGSLSYKRELSNPYIPTERVDVPNPNWVISPYYAQGFFSKIEDFSCRPDGSLYVQGQVGVAADSLRGGAWARGIWRVEPDGRIIPFEVFPGTSYLRGGIHSCTVRTCALAPSEARQRALAEGSIDWAQDKHGNVWGIRQRTPGSKDSLSGCQIKRFNADGTDTLIQGPRELCEIPEGSNGDFRNEPRAIAYDEGRDEMVVSTGKFGGNTDGSLALLRITQQGQVTELLRNWAHSEAKVGQYGYKPNPPGKSRSGSNQVRERWGDLVGLVYHRASQAMRFEVTVFSESNYPSRTYEIKESFQTLRRLPYNSPGQISHDDAFGKDSGVFGDDQKLLVDGTNYQLGPWIFGKHNCYDDMGNLFFMNGISVRRMTPQGKLSTWVK